MYLIMSLNNVNGHLAGYFSSLFHLWLKSTDSNHPAVDGTYAEWTSIMTEAMRFDSEDAAWKFVHGIWGDWFADKCFAVVSIAERGMTDAAEICEIIAKKDPHR